MHLYKSEQNIGWNGNQGTELTRIALVLFFLSETGMRNNSKMNLVDSPYYTCVYNHWIFACSFNRRAINANKYKSINISKA